MLTLTLPQPDKTHYPSTSFLGKGNLLRVTEMNHRGFRRHTDRDIFTLEDEHVLVGLLRMLAIDVEWTLDQVVAESRFRANALCSLFNITSMNKVGSGFYNGFYREGILEHWVLIENNRQYSAESVQLDNMRALVPLYSTETTRGYKDSVLKDSRTFSKPKGFAVIGIDIVELAVGWWTYMRQGREKNTGIHQYCCQYPLFTATLIHNQLAFVNALYEFLVNDVPLESLCEMETVSFTTVSEKKLYQQCFEHTVNNFTGRRLLGIGHLQALIPSLYKTPFFNYLDGGTFQFLQQTKWAWELQPLKLHAIYLSVANRMGYRASDVNMLLKRVLPPMARNFTRIPELYCREHVAELAKKVSTLNLQNVQEN